MDSRWPAVHEWYERATLPIEKGGMAIRNMGMVASTAFACSLATSFKHMATIFLSGLHWDNRMLCCKIHRRCILR